MVDHLNKQILVIGSGNFGTCLAQHLADLGNNIVLLTRDPSVEAGINQYHRNPKYLNMITLSPKVKATLSLDPKALSNFDMILITIPTQAIRSSLSFFEPPQNIEKTLVVCAAKGIEQNTDQLPISILKSVWSSEHADSAVFLSGPSFAEDIAFKHPTAVVVGCKKESFAKRVQQVFHAPHFRTYTSTDPVGLELAGALKNIIAIAAGAVAGLGYESNTQAALLTRGLSEILRLGIACGAQQQTFLGLGGVGDLFLSCSSVKSRNYRVGYLLAKGQKIEEILQNLGSVAEGYYTTKAAVHLANVHKIEVPIINEVAKVLYESKSVESAMRDLLNRDPKSEFEKL